jgi:hypothetical protein
MSRCDADQRGVVVAVKEGQIPGLHIGSAIAIVAFVDSTVRVTIRHNDSAAIASEAATACVSLEEAAEAGRPWKPVMPDARIMV